MEKLARVQEDPFRVATRQAEGLAFRSGWALGSLQLIARAALIS